MHSGQRIEWMPADAKQKTMKVLFLGTSWSASLVYVERDLDCYLSVPDLTSKYVLIVRFSLFFVCIRHKGDTRCRKKLLRYVWLETNPASALT